MIHPVREKQPLTQTLFLYFSVSHARAHMLQNVKFNAFEFITFLQLAYS
jgi:DNA-dependent RNA polymerase auxiliary subunit epsilon